MEYSLVPACVVLLLLLVATAPDVRGFQLTVMHTNDIHGRIEETNTHSSRCLPKTAAKGECFAGQERLSSKIKELRAKYPNSLLLDAGDQYQGSLFFYVYGGPIMADFMNHLKYDAMALGNHEFDRGPKGLKPFLDNVTFPVLCCNIDTSKAPEMESVKKSIVLTVSGEKIGVIGYTTSETPTISKPEPVTFMDEVTAVQAEVDKLAKQGVNKIIGLGHAGYARDLEIAKNVRGLDVIVGGHTNTFLYTGDAPADDKPLGLYPTVIKDPDGHKVLVVQDYAYGKYLGFLQVDFDDNGLVTDFGGNPILMDNSVAKDPEITKLIQQYLPAVEAKKSQKVGESYVHLQGHRSACRVRECNMGNLITDAIVHQNLGRDPNSTDWSYGGIAFFAGGGIRASIDQGEVLMSDILDVMPFQNTIDVFEITGKVLWEVLEHSASRWVKENDLFGGFLQVSGLRVIYDMKQKVGRRVVQAHALCNDCEIPEFKPIDMKKTYRIMSASFTIEGGDGFSMITKNMKSYTSGIVDSDTMLEYITDNSPITKGLDNRIQFLEDVQQNQHCPGAASLTKSSWLLLLTVFAIIIRIPFY